MDTPMAICDSNVCISAPRLLIGQAEKHGVTPETKRTIRVALEIRLDMVICHQRVREHRLTVLATDTKEQ